MNDSESKISNGGLGTIFAILAIVCIIVSAFVGIIAFAIGMVLIVLSAICLYRAYTTEDDCVFPMIAIIIALLGAGVLSVFSIENVDAGEVGVVTSSPMGVGQSVDEGWHFDPKFALSNIEHIRYNTQTTEYVGGTDSSSDDTNGCVMVISKDAMYVYIDMSVTYSIPSSYVSDLRMQYGSDWKSTLLDQNVRSIPRLEGTQYNALDLIGEKRSEFESEVKNKLIDKIESYGITVSDVNIREYRIPDSLQEAVEKKMAAEQDKDRAEIEKQTAITNAEAKKEVALIEAETKLLSAEKEAQAMKELISGFGTVDRYNQYLYIQALTDPDSNITYVVVPSDNGGFILQPAK